MGYGSRNLSNVRFVFIFRVFLNNKTKMLSDLIINKKRVILFVDNIGIEKQSEKIILQCLNEKKEQNIIKYPANSIEITNNLKSNLTTNFNIIIQPISELMVAHKLETIFKLINDCRSIGRVIVWASTKKISKDFVIPFIEHLADMVITLKDSKNLSILMKSSRGDAKLKNYTCHLKNNSIDIKELKTELVNKQTEPTINPEDLGTFKISLEEDEMAARNALTLPYEKPRIDTTTTAAAPKESRIIYHPSPDDDFDEEDPDDDLDI